MFGLIAQVLEFFYSIVPNYAIAIALLTLTVMLILTPLTLKGTRSMMMMRSTRTIARSSTKR
jgi:YidC/Oxa1 family membrane protein insertase